MTIPPATAVATVIPSQVKHPVRTLIRGLIQWVPPIAAAIPLIITTVEDGHPGVTGAYGAAVVFWASAITRVMAIPAVNELLKRVNLDAGTTTLTLPQVYELMAAAETKQDPAAPTDDDEPGKHEAPDVPEVG